MRLPGALVRDRACSGEKPMPMKSLINQIPYKRPLVIGTGGGNDIVSATLIVAALRAVNQEADLAGMCSPGAWHTYDGKEEAPVNVVVSDAKRFLPSKNPVYLSFIDGFLPQLLQSNGLNVRVFNLSCRYGTSKLIGALERLIVEEGYDGIVAVDVGGDILARGPQDPTILSPLMDFSLLYVISKLQTPSMLVQLGLQTDGELRPQSCKEILEELEKDGMVKSVHQLDQRDPAVGIFEKIYRGIEHIRHGHTAHMTLQTLREASDINTEYFLEVRVLDKAWRHWFPVKLEAKYFGQMFVLDPKELAATRPLAFSYSTPLELYIRSKMIVDTKNEMDMLYARVGDACVWLGLLCPQIHGELRSEIIKYGIDRLESHADVALLWEKDASVIPEGWSRQRAGPFVVSAASSAHVSTVASCVEAVTCTNNQENENKMRKN